MRGLIKIGPLICSRGATMWEAQLWRVWVAIRFPRFWRTSGIGFVRITDKDGNYDG